jgi:hypothetical protein
MADRWGDDREGKRGGSVGTMTIRAVMRRTRWERGRVADALQRWQGHGLPPMVLRLLIAEADVAVLEREQTAIGQRDAVDIPPQVLQDFLGALHGQFAVDNHPWVQTDSGMTTSGRS